MIQSNIGEYIAPDIRIMEIIGRGVLCHSMGMDEADYGDGGFTEL